MAPWVAIFVQCCTRETKALSMLLLTLLTFAPWVAKQQKDIYCHYIAQGAMGNNGCTNLGPLGGKSQNKVNLLCCSKPQENYEALTLVPWVARLTQLVVAPPKDPRKEPWTNFS